MTATAVGPDTFTDDIRLVLPAKDGPLVQVEDRVRGLGAEGVEQRARVVRDAEFAGPVAGAGQDAGDEVGGVEDVALGVVVITS